MEDLRSSNLGPLAGQWLVTGWIRAPGIFRSFKDFDPPPFIKSELGFASGTASKKKSHRTESFTSISFPVDFPLRK
jgi:hypothetical protein